MALTSANHGRSQLTRQHRGEDSFCHQLQLQAWESNAPKIRKRVCVCVCVQLRSGAAQRAAGRLTFHSHRGSLRRHHWGGRQSVRGGLTEPRWVSSHHFAAGESGRTAAAVADCSAKKHPGKCSLSASRNMNRRRRRRSTGGGGSRACLYPQGRKWSLFLCFCHWSVHLNHF